MPGSHHATSCEIWALLVLLAIAEEALECPDTIRYQVVGLEKVQVLGMSAPPGLQHKTEGGAGGDTTS